MTLNEYLSKLGIALSGAAISTLGDAITIVTGETAPVVDVIDNPFPITRAATVSGLVTEYTGPGISTYAFLLHNASAYQIRNIAFGIGFTPRHVTNITAQSAGNVTVPQSGNATLALSGGSISIDTSVKNYGFAINRMFHGDYSNVNVLTMGTPTISISVGVVDAAANAKHVYLRKTDGTTTSNQIDLGALSNKTISHSLTTTEVQRLLDGTQDWFIAIA